MGDCKKVCYISYFGYLISTQMAGEGRRGKIHLLFY